MKLLLKTSGIRPTSGSGRTFESGQRSGFLNGRTSGFGRRLDICLRFNTAITSYLCAVSEGLKLEDASRPIPHNLPEVFLYSYMRSLNLKNGETLSRWKSSKS